MITLHFNVAGVTFEGRQDVIAELKQDESLELREQDKGIQIWIGNKHVGWIPDDPVHSGAVFVKDILQIGYKVVDSKWTRVGKEIKGLKINLNMDCKW